MLADPASLPASKIVELADLVTGRVCGRREADEVTIYKAVGVGLQDVAIAGLAWQRFAQSNKVSAAGAGG